MEYESILAKKNQVSQLPNPQVGVSIPAMRPETRLGPQVIMVSASQMFPWFGTLELQGEAATLMAEAKFQSFLDYRNQLYFKSSMSYFPLLEIEELLKGTEFEISKSAANKLVNEHKKRR